VQKHVSFAMECFGLMFQEPKAQSVANLVQLTASSFGNLESLCKVTWKQLELPHIITVNTGVFLFFLSLSLSFFIHSFYRRGIVFILREREIDGYTCAHTHILYISV
jgi:hypothetical protein